jgi:uncharacterized membrane protein YphA (DoxX/SURF4 family)
VTTTEDPATDTASPTDHRSVGRPAPGGPILKLLAVLRILLGYFFVLDFLDKAFGLGIATPPSQVMANKIEAIDLRVIAWTRRLFTPAARAAFFVIFFYFGFLKLIGLSPATPLAEALTAQTIGTGWFHVAFMILAGVECLIGILFLIPRATRIVIPLLLVHMAVVCSPLILVPAHVWVAPFVPNFEGQYIIKNLALVAMAIGLAASTVPLKSRATASSPWRGGS